jgi:hypothetical protein
MALLMFHLPYDADLTFMYLAYGNRLPSQPEIYSATSVSGHWRFSSVYVVWPLSLKCAK